MKDAGYKNARGLIFNIVRSSFVDGYGIRTTIFLKGCPLRCIWCCNPEGQRKEPELKFISENCNGCGNCVSICPQNAIALNDDSINIDRMLCNGCGHCVKQCCRDALDIWGKWYTAQKIFEIIKTDMPFYKASGGGLTIGGGEATLYPEFCLGLIELCHEEGINVAIDTCGYVTSTLGLEVLKKADFLLYDIKGIDDVQHIKDTAVSNRVIFDNLKMLADLNKPVIIRYPAIPEHNSSNNQLKKAAEFLSRFDNIKRVDIIAYHQFGKVKYEQLGIEYIPISETDSEQRQEEIKNIFEFYGLPVQLGG